MKKIIIPLFKTNCGESISGCFYIKEKILTVSIFSEGSQLLKYTIELIQKILNNKNIRYSFYLERIFWRLNILQVSGSRKKMMEDILEYIQSYIRNTVIN